MAGLHILAIATAIAPVCAHEAVGLGNRRLQIVRSGPFLATPLFENTVFLPNSSAIGLQIRQKLCSLEPIFAFDAPSPTAS